MTAFLSLLTSNELNVVYTGEIFPTILYNEFKETVWSWLAKLHGISLDSALFIGQVFRFTNFFEFTCICGFATLDEDFACTGHRETDLVNRFGATQINKNFLWVETGGHPELLHIPIKIIDHEIFYLLRTLLGSNLSSKEVAHLTSMICITLFYISNLNSSLY